VSKETSERVESREEMIKADFLAQDKATRRAVVARRGLREINRPWAATNHQTQYRQTRFPFQTFTFHQGARVNGR
jgi:hypothetical protein